MGPWAEGGWWRWGGTQSSTQSLLHTPIPPRLGETRVPHGTSGAQAAQIEPAFLQEGAAERAGASAPAGSLGGPPQDPEPASDPKEECFRDPTEGMLSPGHLSVPTTGTLLQALVFRGVFLETPCCDLKQGAQRSLVSQETDALRM